MAQLAIDRDFLDDYSRLEKSVQVAVKAAMDKFAEHTRAGLVLPPSTGRRPTGGQLLPDDPETVLNNCSTSR